jgi:hypothetical protein
MQSCQTMSTVKRTKEAIDVLEHAMQGVHTSNDHRIVSFSRERGLIGTRSEVEIDVMDDTPGEREVVVRMPRASVRRGR